MSKTSSLVLSWREKVAKGNYIDRYSLQQMTDYNRLLADPEADRRSLLRDMLRELSPEEKAALRERIVAAKACESAGKSLPLPHTTHGKEPLPHHLQRQLPDNRAGPPPRLLGHKHHARGTWAGSPTAA